MRGGRNLLGLPEGLRYSASSKVAKQTRGIWYFRNAAGMDPELFNELQDEGGDKWRRNQLGCSSQRGSTRLISAIGPLLFLIYVNELGLPDIIESSVRMFADDTKLW